MMDASRVLSQRKPVNWWVPSRKVALPMQGTRGEWPPGRCPWYEPSLALVSAVQLCIAGDASIQGKSDTIPVQIAKLASIARSGALRKRPQRRRSSGASDAASGSSLHSLPHSPPPRSLF